MRNNKSIIEKSNELYDKSANEFGSSSSAVKWDKQETQYLRFSELVKNIDLQSSSKSILDVGCGNGELYKFLKLESFCGYYTGYDINDKLLKIARSRFKNIAFNNVDILSRKFSEKSKFDYVLMSGVFNLNIGQREGWCFDFINKMYQLCSSICAFNAISTYVNYQEEHMFYLNPIKTINYCINNLSPRVELSHHKLPYNYTIIVYK